MATSKFFFGRLTFRSQENLESTCDVWEEILEYVHSDEEVYLDDDSKWYFGKVESSEDVIYGEFGKVITETPVTYDPQRGEFVEQGGDVQAESSLFAIIPEKNMIIFNQKRRIGHRQFREAFTGGLEAKFDIEMDIKLLKNKMEMTDILSEGGLKNAEFQLMDRDDNEGNFLNSWIDPVNAQTISLTFKAYPEEELNPQAEVFQEALDLASYGYGDYLLTMETENGRMRKISSSDQPVTLEVDTEDGISSLIQQLHELEEFAEDHLYNY